LAYALEHAEDFKRGNVWEALNEIVDFETLYGSIHFDKFGKNVTKEMVFFAVAKWTFPCCLVKCSGIAETVYPIPDWNNR
jgi:hypothetical protein